MVFAQVAELGLGFDPFGDDRQTHAVRQRNHRGGDAGRLGVAGDAGDEGLIDLEFIDRKPA